MSGLKPLQLSVGTTSVNGFNSLVLPVFTACDAGSYGNNCTERCGHCLNNETCDVVCGKCQHGCGSGWMGDVCKTGAFY